MANKSSIIFLLLFISLSAYAQDVNYRVDVRYIQRLTWAGDEYAMRYEVIIEKYDNRRYSVFFREFTEEEYIEVSLPSGNYRYQVIPYDFLNSPVHVNDWVEFEVLQAELESPQPENIQTENIQIEVNRFDIYLGAAYMPLLPVYNDNEFFLGKNISLMGAGLRVSVVSAKQGFVSPGLELLASWRMYDQIESITENAAQSITVDINFLAQMRFINGRTALNFRIGAGVSLLSDIPPVSTTGLYSLHANLGISFLFLVTRYIYLELGADYSQFFTMDHFGFFRPWLGIGVKI